MKTLTLTVAAAAFFAVAANATALPPNGTFGFIPFAGNGTTFTTTGSGNLSDATTITVDLSDGGFLVVNTTGPATYLGNPNQFHSPNIVGQIVTLNPLIFSTLQPLDTPVAVSLTGYLQFAAGGDTFSFDADTLVTSSSGPSELTVGYVGTLHDTSVTPQFSDAEASLLFSFNQVGQGSTNWSATFATPPDSLTASPEPATLGLFGSAFVGLGLLGRKRLGKK